MRWPPEHPAVTDPALSPWRAGADELCPDAEVLAVLRHLPGRRVASLVHAPKGPAVLKVFASPRARGNHRRLATLAATTAAAVVPRPLAADGAGHVGLVEFVAGTPMPLLDDDAYVAAAAAAGLALRRLHASGAVLDRAWGPGEELEQLGRTAGTASRAVVEAASRRWAPGAADGLVPAHRDCHPAQAVAGRAGVRWIDLDDAAMAPAALDVGNFLAHLDKEAATGSRGGQVVEAAAAAFVDGYGRCPDGMGAWRALALARLAALAETRHRDPDAMSRLAALLG